MADVQKTPFVRDLASSDRKTRDKALDSLTLFLRSKTNLSLIELLKLWKGLFFCFYHSDRPLTQQALARSLSYSLVPTLPRATVHRFLRAFWITIGREFHSIDRLRLDKYMFLIRCYVGVAFEVFLKGKQDVDGNGSGKKRKREESAASSTKGGKRSKGKKQVNHGTNDTENADDDDDADDTESTKWSDLTTYITILEEGPLNPLNFDPDQPSAINEKTDYVPMPHGPDGLRYHIMDLWLDELEKVLEFEEGDENEDKDEDDGNPGPKFASRKVKGDVPMGLLLRPLETLRTKGLHKPVRTRAGQALDDDRLVEWGVKEPETPDEDDEEDDEDEEEWGGFGDE